MNYADLTEKNMMMMIKIWKKEERKETTVERQMHLNGQYSVYSVSYDIDLSHI